MAEIRHFTPSSRLTLCRYQPLYSPVSGRYNRHTLCNAEFPRRQPGRDGGSGGRTTTESKLPQGRRVATSDDLEVSAYLEIAKGLEGIGPEDDDGQHSVNEGVVVIDFGSQYSHLIARRVRELKVYSMIAQSMSTWDSVKHLNPKGVILSGGPASVYEEGAPQIPSWVCLLYTSPSPRD